MEEPKEKLCERCINHIRTKEAHNGDFNEIRDYRYCKLLDIQDDDLDWTVQCDGFEQKKVEDKELQSKEQKALKGKGKTIVSVERGKLPSQLLEEEDREHLAILEAESKEHNRIGGI